MPHISLPRCRIILATLLAATTANAQWEILTPPTTADLRGIDNVGGGVAWASGTGGTVVRTEDGGYLWQRCSIPPGAEHLDFRGIQAFDEKTAIVMSSGKGSLSRLYKTTDGCQTWRLLFPNPDPEGFWDAIQFKDRNFGVLLGDPVNNIFVVMLTFDGGEKWERQTLRATEDINGEGVFAASNSSLLLGRALGDREFCTGGPGGPRVIGLNPGHTDTPNSAVQKTAWSDGLFAARLPIKGPFYTGRGCFSLATDAPRTGYWPMDVVAVGGNYQTPDDRENTAWTTASMPQRNVKSYSVWNPAITPPHGYRSAVAYDAPTKTWITVGPNGTDISTDDGRNWRALRPNPALPEPADKIPADRNWNALSLPFVVGPHGRIGKLRSDALTPVSAPMAVKP